MGTVSDLAGRRIYLDANVFVYALEGLAPWAGVADAVLRLADAGQLNAVTSELTLAECLVKPLRIGHQAGAQVYLDAIRDRPELTVVPISRAVLFESARLRAAHPTLKTPDAVHLATASAMQCAIILTNDARLRSCGLSLTVALLSDLTP